MIQPATPELLALAAKARPDWDQRDLSSALAAARHAGWDWPRTLVEVARLIANSDAEPRDLVKAVQKPTFKPHGTPADAHAAAAHARDLCGFEQRPARPAEGGPS